VTLFYGILDADQKTLRYINAGHNPPLLLDPQGGHAKLDVGGIVLGAIPQFPYEEGETGLTPGQILVLYSDGITESTDEKDEQFGEERLIQTVRRNADLSSSEICEQIIEAVRTFSCAVPRQDDITLVIAKILG
jgi:sigma-B regulation protein RsbU (phosphoserine phosphatase)